MNFTIAIIGRPNVGKSTLFNRLTGTKHAIVHDLPGVTRDTREGMANIGPLNFNLIDTPGLESATSGSLADRMTKQTAKGLQNADLVMMLVDAKTGLLPDDKIFSNWVRKYNKPVILVINKCESKNAIINMREFYNLGFEKMTSISAEHGEGLADLYDLIVPYQDLKISHSEKEEKITLAVVGRPNAGKSSLINRLLQSERVLVGPEAGITRDAIAIDWQYRDTKFKLIDTAGIRKKVKIESQIEKLSLEDSFRAIQYANIVVLLVDAQISLESQDVAIANKVIEEGRALIIAVNKWDKIIDKTSFIDLMDYKIDKLFNQVRGINICYISAINGYGLDKLMLNIIELYQLWNIRISTAKINNWLSYALMKHQLPLTRLGKRIKIKYATQIKSRPPTFVLFTNYPKDIPDNYTKYLIGSIRDYLKLPAVPIRILYKKSNNPFNNKDQDNSNVNS